MEWRPGFLDTHHLFDELKRAFKCLKLKLMVAPPKHRFTGVFNETPLFIEHFVLFLEQIELLA
jgi:hypothetical protein